MKEFIANIEGLTDSNEDFRRVVFTGSHLQLVLMTLPPGQDIGVEVHEDTDQFFRVEDGWGLVSVEGRVTRILAGDVVVIPAGVPHNISNDGESPLRLYTIYAPPEHGADTVHPTRADAEFIEIC